MPKLDLYFSFVLSYSPYFFSYLYYLFSVLLRGTKKKTGKKIERKSNSKSEKMLCDEKTYASRFQKVRQGLARVQDDKVQEEMKMIKQGVMKNS